MDYHYNKECSLPDTSPYPIVSDKKYFYVSSWMCNALTKYSIGNGKEIWKVKLEDATSAISLLYRDKVFVGSDYAYENSFVRVIDAITGKILHQEKSYFETRMKPLQKENKIYYYAYNHTLCEFDMNENASKILYRFTESDDISGSEMYLLDDAIYFQNPQDFLVYRFDLKTNKKKYIGKYNERMISGVYKDKYGKVVFLY